MDYKYETHMHTAEVSACAVKYAAQQVMDYIDRGFTGIIITDHFINGYTTCPKNLSWDESMRFFYNGYQAAKTAGDRLGLDVFFGWEYSIRGADFLTYGLDLRFLLSNPNFDKMNIEEYSVFIRKAGGYLAQAHPYRKEDYIEHDYPVQPHLIDGVEVYNAMDKKEANDKALAFAIKNDLPMQAGTDSHGRGNVFYRGIGLKKRAKTIFDIINAIKAKEVKIL